MINIQELFYSIQAEGKQMGVPSVFVRTGLCNFTCAGFKVPYMDPITHEEKFGCDSYYAVDKNFKNTWTPYLDYMDLVTDIDAVIPYFGKMSLTKPDIVLTGGEPLIFWKDEMYQRVISHYISRGHKVTIETNASLDIEFTRKYQEEIIFSASVKLSCSGEPEHKRFNIETLTKIAEYAPNSYLKFVTSVETWEQDIKEIKSLLSEIPVYMDIYLMPLGDTRETLEKNARFVIEKSMELGFKYSDRIHIRIWDNKQGV